MAVLELWLLAAAVTGNAAPPPKPAAPDTELLEFIGEWTDEQGRDIDPFADPEKSNVSEGGNHEQPAAPARGK